MKEPSPLVPQGSFEAQARSKSRVKLAFYTIVAIHLLAIGGFLIIGCKREDSAAEPPPPTNDMATTPPFGTDPAVMPAASTNVPGLTQTQPPTDAGTVPPPTTTTTPPPLVTPPPTVPVTPPPVVVPDVATTVMTEHTIVKGDSFSTLASKYGVTVKDIQTANPNLNPTRLQIGDKVKIPPKSATTAANGTRTAAAADAGTYTVKSGDTLSKIATAHKTTVKELQRLNNLATTQIRVGQKLKLPQSASSPAGTGSGGTAVPTGTTPPPVQ